MSSRARGSITSRTTGDFVPEQRRISAQTDRERVKRFENPYKFEEDCRPKGKLADE
jgi:hypothetical protein